MLLPCWWGVGLAMIADRPRWVDLWIAIACAIGAIAMRGAGEVDEPLFEGIVELLDSMRNDGWLLGVATGKSDRGLRHCLAAHGIADRFVAALAERMSAIRVGSPLSEDVDLGPLADRRAAENVRRLVEDALVKGAVLVAEAKTPEGPGHYVPATVLDHVPADAAIMHEEVFGPVAAIRRFSTEAEALVSSRASAS